MQLLLVDDELELTTPLSRVLQGEGYGVDVAHDGDRGLAMALAHPYDLLILDWMLPRRSGPELCQILRGQGTVVPVLFLTAKDTLDDRVTGLDAGADDYLVKPFELRELLARVRALLRRVPNILPLAGESARGSADVPASAVPTSRVLQFGEFELDSRNQIARRKGMAIELSEKETQLLQYLMQHQGQLLTHGQIQAHLWGADHQPNSNVLAAQVRLLRRKLERGGAAPLIHSVYGKGYRFGAD
jgi:two-component system, OmpR family, manganese sensing response regulator